MIRPSANDLWYYGTAVVLGALLSAAGLDFHTWTHWAILAVTCVGMQGVERTKR